MPLLALLALAGQTLFPVPATDRVIRPADPVRVIVEYRESGSRSVLSNDARALLASLHQRLRRDATAELHHEYARVYRGAALTVPRAKVEALRALPYVKSVQEDMPVKAMAEDEASVSRIGAERFWSVQGKRGEGVVVAIIDTGIDAAHARFAGGKVLGGYDFVGKDTDPSDEQGHGTHVAGTVLDVAPEAKLVAYRVLDAEGKGWGSDIIAAIERAVDPNEDGDFSDRAHVINLSLGGFGNANDSLSRAVNAAVDHGTVVVAAAGNDGRGLSIGSPAAAERAITVGAADRDDALAVFSSRGPAYLTFGLKPEIVAPGVEIRSAKRGGGTVVYSGTSMAAPHVAGAAALLLSDRPELTSWEIKSLLVTTATPIVAEPVAQGGGRIDVDAAANARYVVQPAAVTFGRNPIAPAEWSSSASLLFTNLGSEAATFGFAVAPRNGITLTFEPATLTLAPGATAEMRVTMHVDNAAAGAPSLDTLSFGGRIAVSVDGTPAGHLPWIVMKAARVTTESDEPATMFSFVSDAWPRGFDPFAAEILVPAGKYLMAAVSSDRVIMQSHDIHGDLAISVTEEDAPHRLTLDSVDESGRTLASFSGNVQREQRFRLIAPGLSWGLHVRPGVLKLSDFPEGVRLLAAETLFDLERHRAVVVQHEPLTQTAGSMVLRNTPDFRRVRVRLDPATVEEGSTIGMSAQWVETTPGGEWWDAETPLRVPYSGAWRGEILTTPDPDPEAGLSVLIGAGRLGASVVAPPLRARGGKLWFGNEVTKSPASPEVQEGELVPFGLPTVHASPFAGSLRNTLLVLSSEGGPYRETIWRMPLTTRVYDGATGALLLTHENRTYVEHRFDERRPLRVEITSPAAETTLTWDMAAEDTIPPVLTALRFVDAAGAVTGHLEPNEPAALLFAIADHTNDGWHTISRSLEHAATRAYWRTEGGEWQPLTLTEGAEDSGHSGQLGHIPTGTHYRADLTAIAQSIRGPIDVRIDFADAAGNTVSTRTLRAISVQSMGRRRVVR
ncbi:MAG TPA: S8 family serine peptidase [Thermoanaerobaculia bacterium]